MVNRIVGSAALLVLLVSVSLVGTAGVALGQDEAADSTAPTGLLNVFSSAPTSELELRLMPATAAELEQLSVRALEDLQVVTRDLASAIIQWRRREADPSAAAGDVDQETLQQLARMKADLVTRTNLVLVALEAKGGDVAAARAYVAVAQSLAPPSDAPSDEASEAPPKPQEERLEERVRAAIAVVREQPPAHERPQPWLVDIGELELEMQPLTREQLEERTGLWLQILQRAVRERIRVDIALTNTEDPELTGSLAARSAEQQEIVRAIVERVEVALVLLQRRGGEVKAHRDYIASATGQRINLNDPAVLFAQGMVWLKSADGGVRLGLNVLEFLGILVAFWIASRVLGRIVLAAVNRIPKASSLLREFLVGGTKRVTMIIGVVVAVSALGVNITPLIAAIGAAGLVIGLALQGTLSNFASGILILIYRPYDVGDMISAGGVTGKVEAMNLVSTSILTLDNQAMLVPNNEIWNGVITNITGRSERRVDLVFGISYSADIARAIAAVEAVMKGHAKVLPTPEPIVRVHQLGDNSVNLVARPWARTADYWDVYWDIMRAVKERFDADGIGIPFPQRDLHVPGGIEVRLVGGNGGRDRSAPAATRASGGGSGQAGADAPGTDDESAG